MFVPEDLEDLPAEPSRPVDRANGYAIAPKANYRNEIV